MKAKEILDAQKNAEKLNAESKMFQSPEQRISSHNTGNTEDGSSSKKCEDVNKDNQTLFKAPFDFEADENSAKSYSDLT